MSTSNCGEKSVWIIIDQERPEANEDYYKDPGLAISHYHIGKEEKDIKDIMTVKLFFEGSVESNGDTQELDSLQRLLFESGVNLQGKEWHVSAIVFEGVTAGTVGGYAIVLHPTGKNKSNNHEDDDGLTNHGFELYTTTTNRTSSVFRTRQLL
ncbi:hypothetical protein BDB00DRAFT_880464 [Zychaea mexicana]|uniref:uncharacterized protein n=1 Tax=Zychaea mexicana TaxID=64656 RepID=UPI0022FE49B5|nr:uncharacterized protein BDB00DRAFT_880464 [Zychaea mexicana]KAI9467793.1 hypothetical protein BDB00DRAFT_880464 [Zychaea mexicana]